MTTPEDAVEILNRIHAADPSVLPALIEHRVRCNYALAIDETVQVGRIDDDPNGPWEVGLLGIINGLFGTRPDGWGFIAAHYDDDHKLVRFEITDR